MTTTRLSPAREANVTRAAELASIASALEDSRLVTLCGPGGVGKSRLALQAATAIRDSFGQRAWLVELSGVRDPELLPRAVTMSFRTVDEAGDDPRQLFLSKRTIDSHVEHIFAKLGFSARSQIVGWISDQKSDPA